MTNSLCVIQKCFFLWQIHGSVFYTKVVSYGKLFYIMYKAVCLANGPIFLLLE